MIYNIIDYIIHIEFNKLCIGVAGNSMFLGMYTWGTTFLYSKCTCFYVFSRHSTFSLIFQYAPHFSFIFQYVPQGGEAPLWGAAERRPPYWKMNEK